MVALPDPTNICLTNAWMNARLSVNSLALRNAPMSRANAVIVSTLSSFTLRSASVASTSLAES